MSFFGSKSFLLPRGSLSLSPGSALSLSPSLPPSLPPSPLGSGSYLDSRTDGVGPVRRPLRPAPLLRSRGRRAPGGGGGLYSAQPHEASPSLWMVHTVQVDGIHLISWISACTGCELPAIARGKRGIFVLQTTHVWDICLQWGSVR